MKTILSFAFLLILPACKQSILPFNIDSARTYTPTELVSQATGSCQVIHPWEGKPVRVTGHIESLNLFTGKFWLYDDGGRGFVEIYSADPATQSGRDVYEFAKANTGRTITVTGSTVGNNMPTQLNCTKGVAVKITDKTAITF
ncbi:hypothetical protein [Fibrella forsythiae]|uniref:Lipoprotein n=1 Tax=Fibrella forsythiae TaxID=2817061 RepID=A0ABS3JIF4_9BACT|nr:hypothetical protein [Fibrella forsythiae]MBO0949788.1 hypothetical protein [Fibrella forsythiae]